MVKGFLLSLRPKQWTKNLLLFAGLVFAQQWTNPRMFWNAVAGFAIFCALSGVVYITNDILDIEKDRHHPKKKFRPIASGAVPPAVAGSGAVVLAVGSLWYAFHALPFNFALEALLYLVLITAYSFRLKHLVVLDILVIAMGFVIRALAGIEVLRIPGSTIQLTSYFLMTTLFLALFLAICKRRNELVLLGEGAGSHRQVLANYSTQYLDVLLMVATACVLFSYALWTTQGQFAHSGKSGETYVMVLTMPFVIYGVFRYIWLVYQRDEGGAPETLLLSDVPLLATVVGWVATVIAILVTSKVAKG